MNVASSQSAVSNATGAHRNDLVQQLRSTLYNAEADTAASVVDATLHNISTYTIVDHSKLKAVANIILNQSYHQPILCCVLPKHLSKLPNVLPFLDVLPQMFAMCSSKLVDNVVRELLRVIEAHEELLIPVLGVIIELPMSEQSKPVVSRLADASISLVDSADLPVLTRVLLRTANVLECEETVKSLRHEVVSTAITTLALGQDG